jgi:hypothetical protein
MYSFLTELLVSAHSDELRRRASRQRLARQAHRSGQAAARNAHGSLPARLLNFRLAGKRSQLRPAAA